MEKLSSNTLSIFESATNEKDIENNYRYYFKTIIPDIVFTSPYGCDGLGVSESNDLRVLCEFKDDLNLHSRNDLCKVLCQSVYYIKKFELAGQKLPKTIFIGDRNECLVLHVNDVFNYLSRNYDWNIVPSSAHKNLDLFQEIYKDDGVSPFVFGVDDLPSAIKKCLDLTQNVKRLIPITPHNMTEVFNYFEKNVVGQHKLTTNELANLFIQILISPQENYPHPVKLKKVVVTKNYGEVPVKSKESFDSFFAHFSREYTPREKEVLTSIVDRLIEDTTRRKQGEFFTPTIWVDEAHKMITEVFGENWKEEYIVWDPAWGTGNLTRDYKFKELYVSTLNQSDIDTANQMGYNPEASKFQYDFLNDGIIDGKIDIEGDNKLSEGLKRALFEGKKIIVLMNPPYGTSTNFGETSKKDIATTEMQKIMKSEKWGSSSQQLYAQFLCRLSKIGNVKICMFSPPLFMSGGSYKQFRKKFLDIFGYKSGFLMNASEFDGTSDWGLSFTIWDELNDKKDYFSLIVKKSDEFGSVTSLLDKSIYNLDSKCEASKWVRKEIKNIKTIDPLVSLKSSINLGNKRRGRMFPNQLASLMLLGNSVMTNGQGISFFSYPSSTECFGVMNNNIFKTTSLFLSKRAISGNWINWYDEYMAPDESHPDWKQFQYDSIIYSLFESKSNQSSLRQISYKDKLWDIKNEFFWMSKNEMLELSNQNNYSDLYNDARTDSDRHVYKLLFGEERIYDKLSPDAKQVLDYATELVRKSMQMREIFSTDENHLKSWDAGYAQLKLLWKEYYAEEFKEFRQLYKNLEDRMRPLVYELGFLLK